MTTKIEPCEEYSTQTTQWEQAKRLGDLAFDEYAKKWPAPEGGYR